MRSIDTTLQPQHVMSPTTVSGCSLVDQQVMDQVTQMRSKLSSFLGQKQETARTAFYNYLASEVEGLEEKDFQIFRHEAVKLLSNIQSKAEERGRQPHHQTLSQSSIATSTFVPQTFQQPQAARTSCKGIHLNHPRDTDAFKPGHPTCSTTW